jgi:hypothetical protein
MCGSAVTGQLVVTLNPTLPRGTASITGVVLGEGRPVSGAKVVLGAHGHYSPNYPEVAYTPLETVTDDRGRFAFANVSSLPLELSASAPGFVRGVYGQAQPGFEGTPIQLTGSQHFEPTVHLKRGGRISGSVFDGRGEPAGGIQVYAFRLEPIGDTETLMTGDAGAVTDERGQYTISDLPGGRFLVSAYRVWGSFERSPLQKGADGGWVVESGAVYPAGTRAIDASAIALRLGESRAGIDLRLRLEPATTARGLVRNADGSPVQNARVQLFPRDGQSFTVSDATTGADGSFELERVTPGAYRIVAYSQPGEPRWGEAVVDSDGRLPIRTTLTLRPGGTVTGRVVAVGKSKLENPRPFRLFLRGTRGDVPGLGGSSAAPDFTYRGVPPGRYAISVNRESLPAGWFVQSEMVDGVDALDFPFEMKGSETRNVVITLSDAWTEIAGAVTDTNGAASTDGTIVIFPADESYWGVSSRRIETLRPDTNGRYRFRGLPAGDYVIALGSAEIDGRPHSLLLRTLRSSGHRVTLRPGESLRVDFPAGGR